MPPLQLPDGQSVLIDCGLFQGAETSPDGAGAQSLEIGFSLDGVRALVVRHVHIDHVGRIPYLLAAGFKGPIVCSEASAVLLPLVIEDALKVGLTRNQGLIDRVLAVLRRQLVQLAYGQWHPLVSGTPGLRVRLAPAGHILGSAYVEFDAQLAPGRGPGQRQRVVFSGDLGAPYTPLLPAPRAPMAADFTAGYAQLKSQWDREARRKLAAGRHPLAFEQLTTVGSHAQHLRMVDTLARSGRPAIVVAASGMCSGGRIVNYLKAMLGDPRHDVLFCGYQAAGTPGRDIQTYGPRGGYVQLDGQRFDIRAGVHTLSGFSAHADQKNLLNFIGRMRTPPGQVRLVHGDDEAKRTLAGLLRQRHPGVEVVVP